jgi:Lrp/AsnC family transcriptional regulator, leucine-responsive regulatory protein
MKLREAVAQQHGVSAEPSTPLGANWALDAIDRRLLTLLSVDARTSLRSLGMAVGLSGPAVADRISRLTERGVIRGFSVNIDWACLGLPTLTHISLLADKTSDIERVMSALRDVVQVEEISIVTGSTDLLVRARVADLADLRRLLIEQIWPIEGVHRVETALSVETERPSDFAARLLRHQAGSGNAGTG